MPSLIDRLNARADSLTDEVLAEQLRDPFWEERYGERARRFGREDGRYHITYLCEALAAGQPVVLVRYAFWLRSVLTARGMCSRHLAENFRLLGAAIAREPSLDGGAAAVDYLARAAAALRYGDGPASALEADAALADDVLAALRADRPDRHPAEPRLRDDLATLLSYLADALAVAEPRRFAEYVSFLRGSYARRALPRATLDDLLGHLARRLEGRHVEGAAIVTAAIAAPSTAGSAS